MRDKISVIVTTYNREKMVKRAIESVVAQTYSNWELIVIDDGSKDETFQVINKYFSKIESLKYLKQNNLKLPSARNIGLKLAEGKFITFLDSDDEYKKDHLKLRLDFMNTHQNVDLVYGGVEIIGDPYVPDKYDQKRVIHIDKCVVGATFFGKRKVFTQLKGFKDVEYSEDSEFFERARKKFVVVKVDFPTYIYIRNNPDSITKKAYK